MASPQGFGERSSQTLTLDDGRTLGFAEFGRKDGSPIFHCHGLPGCRYEGRLFEAPALEHNARIITIDRPGIGLSSPQPGRTALDHAKDVQAVAKHLGISSFSLMGVSGGGPYALACAYAIPPAQLRNVAVVAGCGVYNAETYKGMYAINRWMFWALKMAPWAADIFVRIIFAPMLRNSDEAWYKQSQESIDAGPGWGILPEMDEKDKAALQDGEMNRTLIPEIREHFKQGFYTYTVDGQILGGDLGFDIAEVQAAKVDLWYGKLDVAVPLGIGEDYARRLKDKARLRVLDETHLSLVKDCGGIIIKNLLA